MPYKDPEARRAYNRSYYHAHIEQSRANARASQAKRREQNNAYSLMYRLTYPEKIRQKSLKYRIANKEILREKASIRRAANPQANRNTASAWRKANPEKVLTHTQEKRARKANAPLNDLTAAQWLEIQVAQDHRCYYCGKRCKGRLTQDHIIPLSKGGSHTLHNVIGACRSCNSKKHTGAPLIPVQPLLLTLAPSKKNKVS